MQPLEIGRTASQNKQEAVKLINSFLSENMRLSDFNWQFKKNTEQVFQNIKQDNYLYFDSSTGQYYLEKA